MTILNCMQATGQERSSIKHTQRRDMTVGGVVVQRKGDSYMELRFWGLAEMASCLSTASLTF